MASFKMLGRILCCIAVIIFLGSTFAGLLWASYQIGFMNTGSVGPPNWMFGGFFIAGIVLIVGAIFSAIGIE